MPPAASTFSKSWPNTVPTTISQIDHYFRAEYQRLQGGLELFPVRLHRTSCQYAEHPQQVMSVAVRAFNKPLKLRGKTSTTVRVYVNEVYERR